MTAVWKLQRNFSEVLRPQLYNEKQDDPQREGDASLKCCAVLVSFLKSFLALPRDLCFMFFPMNRHICKRLHQLADPSAQHKVINTGAFHSWMELQTENAFQALHFHA